MTLFHFILGYLLIVFVGVRFVVPHFGLSRDPLPETITEDMHTLIQRLNAEAKDDYDFLQKAYTYVTSTYRGGRMGTLLHFWTAFENPLNHAQGFMTCNGQNYVLRFLLVKSGRFTEAQIKMRVAMVNLFIHQYLRVLANGRWINVDPWASQLGVSLGKKASFFA